MPATTLDIAISRLDSAYRAFPMPISTGVTIVGLTIALALLVIMLAVLQDNAKIRGRMLFIVVGAPVLTLVALLLGSKAEYNRDLAQIAAANEMSAQCAVIHSAAIANSTQVLTKHQVVLVEGLCGAKALGTIKPTVAG